MKTIVNDRRTDAQKQTLNIAVIAHDKFMGGWGKAGDGKSYCAWCLHDPTNETLLQQLFDWVEARGEMLRVREVDLADWEPPAGCAHFSIYVTYPEHPAFRGTR